MISHRYTLVVALGTTQTLAWASSYYLPAILAGPMARDLGISSAHVFGIFSLSLFLSALMGPAAGRWIDRHGGRSILGLSNIIFAAGLALLGSSYSVAQLWLAWVFLGAGMGIGLYDAAFATLGRLFGTGARGLITGITLLAGFASTVGWPLSAWGLAEIGWRNTCYCWAAAHILFGLPVNLLLIPRVTPNAQRLSAHEEKAEAKAAVRIDRTMVLLAFAFAAAWFVTAAMASHLPGILQASGATATQAVAAAALVGPAQVAARIFEITMLQKSHPLVSARLSAVTHPLGAALLLASGGAGAAGLFALFHGAGNGILTIARGTVPLAIYGPLHYGYRLGILGAPSRIAQASAPLVFGLLLEAIGAKVLLVSSALSLAALAALLLIRQGKSPPD